MAQAFRFHRLQAQPISPKEARLNRVRLEGSGTGEIAMSPSPLKGGKIPVLMKVSVPKGLLNNPACVAKKRLPEESKATAFPKGP